LLPFQKPKHAVGVIIKKRKPDGDLPQDAESQDSDDEALVACAEDILRAISAKDSKALAAAMHAAFQIMELEPHAEGPHDESYDSQNIKAAEYKD